MEITFKSAKLAKECNNRRLAVRAYGEENAKLLMRRMADIEAAECLEDLPPHRPIRRHGLKGERAGQFAVDLKHPFRLVFEPEDSPVPKLEDGSIDLARISKIRILKVEDYHGD